MKHTRTAALLLLTLVLAGCAGGGQKDPPVTEPLPSDETTETGTDAPETEPPATEPPETDAPETDTPETDVACFGYTTPTQLLPFRANDGSILNLYAFRAEATAYTAVPLPDGRVLLVLNDTVREDDGRASPVHVRVQLLDPESGAVSTELPLTGGDAPHSVSYTDDGCILFDTVWDGEKMLVSAAWHIRTEGAWSAESIEFDLASVCSARFVSPAGEWAVYESADNGSGAALTAQGRDGTPREIARDIVPPELNEETIASARGYRGVGFLDESRFVYNIIGWERSIGYGILNLATGERQEFENGCGVSTISDGKLYGTSSGYVPSDLLALGEDGTKTVLADAQLLPDGMPEGVFEALFAGEADYGYSGGLLYITLYGEDGAPSDTYFLDAALTAVFSHIEFTQPVSVCRIFAAGAGATVFWK